MTLHLQRTALRLQIQTLPSRPQIQTLRSRQTQPTLRHDPSNPLADKDGNVWDAGVDSAGELVEMMETSRQYQNNVQVLQTAKSLTLDTLRLEK